MSEPVTGPWDVDDATYFEDTDNISNSMMRVAARSIPEYHQRFVTKTMPSPKPSAEMRLGTLLHACLLEPAAYAARITTEKVDGRTKAGREYNARITAYAEANPRALFVTAEEEDAVAEMNDAVMAKPESRDAMTLPGVHEGPIRWKDGGSGLWLKAKLDKVCDNGLICDLKTTSDIANFPWSAHKYGYERQAAHYLAGAWDALGRDGPFLLVVVSSVAPFEVRTMVFGEDELRSGRIANARLLAELAECYRSGKWESRYKGIEVLRYKHYQLED